jgi:hypothetical protein
MIDLAQEYDIPNVRDRRRISAGAATKDQTEEGRDPDERPRQLHVVILLDVPIPDSRPIPIARTDFRSDVE